MTELLIHVCLQKLLQYIHIYIYYNQAAFRYFQVLQYYLY